jgi:hypothetical protein
MGQFAYYGAVMTHLTQTDSTTEPFCLPSSCEPALLERFLKAEAMALWAVRSSQLQEVPQNVRTFLRRHEEDEHRHLAQFEAMLGHQAHERGQLPSVPRQWPALAMQLFGYEALGLEFALLLADVRPDLSSILEDELAHVGFFEREIGKILAGEPAAAEHVRMSARAWWRKLPRTLDRYVAHPALEPYRSELTRRILSALERRLIGAGLLRQ